MGLFPREYLQITQGTIELSILQWNVLSDSLADCFPRVDPEYLQWEYRKPLILLELDRWDSDIICMEEVDHYNDFYSVELKRRGYEGIYQMKASMNADGTAIF